MTGKSVLPFRSSIKPKNPHVAVCSAVPLYCKASSILITHRHTSYFDLYVNFVHNDVRCSWPWYNVENSLRSRGRHVGPEEKLLLTKTCSYRQLNQYRTISHYLQESSLHITNVPNCSVVCNSKDQGTSSAKPDPPTNRDFPIPSSQKSLIKYLATVISIHRYH